MHKKPDVACCLLAQNAAVHPAIPPDRLARVFIAELELFLAEVQQQKKLNREVSHIPEIKVTTWLK